MINKATATFTIEVDFDFEAEGNVNDEKFWEGYERAFYKLQRKFQRIKGANKVKAEFVEIHDEASGWQKCNWRQKSQCIQNIYTPETKNFCQEK